MLIIVSERLSLTLVRANIPPPTPILQSFVKGDYEHFPHPSPRFQIREFLTLITGKGGGITDRAIKKNKFFFVVEVPTAIKLERGGGC